MSRRRTTGLVVPIEGARRHVEHWLYLIPAMSRDVPPHVTVLWPFLSPDDVDEAVERQLADLFAGEAPFEVSFDGFGRFPDAVFLRPEPAGRFMELTALIERQWPEFPPFGGAYDAVVPHLTIALDPTAAECESIERELGPLLPLRADVREVLLFEEGVGGVHRPRRTFALGV